MTGFMDDNDLADVLSEFSRAQQPTILAVDDIADNLDLIVDVLDDEPWSVVTAGNARDAWEILKKSAPDLVLLDIQMPDIDGHQLCMAIRKLPQMADVPIIFLTAERLSTGDIVRGLELGADDYICKPCNADELRARVRSALRRRLSKQQSASNNRSAAARGIPMKKQTILFVDDNQDSLDLMQEMLAPNGYKVLCATSGREAIRLMHESAPDLIILDIMMPDMNGFSVLDCVRGTRALKHIPVIFQTAFASREHGHRIVDAGESYMLCKPLDAGLFVKVVERCLREGVSGQECEHENAVSVD